MADNVSTTYSIELAELPVTDANDRRTYGLRPEA